MDWKRCRPSHALACLVSLAGLALARVLDTHRLLRLPSDPNKIMLRIARRPKFQIDVPRYLALIRCQQRPQAVVRP